MNRAERYETLQGEGLKTVAEFGLEQLGASKLGSLLLERYAFDGHRRLVDSALQTHAAGVNFENPVIVGAGWDKKGRAVHGLYHLGFGSVEVGTVLPFRQRGNPQPRLWTIDQAHSVGLNRLGFNSPGIDEVEINLRKAWPLPCPIGLNVGRHAIMPNKLAGWSHGEVIKRLGGFASYIVLGISSPNSEDLRGLQEKEYFRELIQMAFAAMPRPLPLFPKIDGERTPQQLSDMIEVALEEGVAGFVAINTYSGSDLKAKYGRRWAQQAGGLSGADREYQDLAVATVRHIHEEAGDKLAIIGAGGINSPDTALDIMKAGASAVELVTAIRPTRGRVAANINHGFLHLMDRDGVKNIREYIGVDTKRGVKLA